VGKANLARQVIAYLAQTDFVLKWGFSEADPPSKEIERLLRSCFGDGEIERTTSSLLCDYLVSRLREDYPMTDHIPQSCHAACRVVCGDGDEE
jgi:hypothetical protein